MTLQERQNDYTSSGTEYMDARDLVSRPIMEVYRPQYRGCVRILSRLPKSTEHPSREIPGRIQKVEPPNLDSNTAMTMA